MVAGAVLANPGRRAVLAAAFCTAFEFKRAAAPLLLHAGASDAGPRASAAISEAAAPDGASSGGGVPVTEEDAADSLGVAATSPGSAAAAARDADAMAGRTAAAALPRMPMGLAYVGSRRAYGALATAMRLTGRLAVLAGPGAH